jgi:uncharacterized protein YukE
MDPLEVNPDNLSASSAAFTEIANTARRIGNGMQDGLSALGNFAGNDRTGRNFTPDFTSGTTGLVNTFLGLGDGMDGTADGLKNSAAAYQATDENNADSIHPTSLP